MSNPVEIVASSPRMVELMIRLTRVAPLDTTVLLEGESGTGKEVAARFLHEGHAGRRNRPFVCVHCGAIPENLLESELFGHVRGAFTGAERDRVGRFEQADGGTLFLDEVGTMSLDAQIRLLRVLQERQITPIGLGESRPINVRVIAATNDRLRDLVDDGRFRRDLYYRLATYPLELPPVRDRAGDVPRLVKVVARRVAERLGRPRPQEVTDDAMLALVNHDWPGNVREIENAIEFGTIQSLDRSVIEKGDLPPELIGSSAPSRAAGAFVPSEGLSFRTAITNLERDLILQSLQIADGNKARAAELLDLKRTTFLEKLRRLETPAYLVTS